MGLLALAGLCVAFPAHAQMSLPGKFEVTDTGSASYTIPISVVPGTAGLEPKLSLQYDSRSGNGLLGVGWSLAGLPAITRCGRTIAQDGQVGGVGYDANDRFCLDGQRLIATSGSYGADGTEYRTERESFSKVISYGQAGSGPSWFKVWTKAGLIMEFGNTADSRIEAQGKQSVRVWAINKTSDTKSNYFTVSYIEDNANGGYRPDRIDYTGNAAAGTPPTNSVRFVYETRPDIVPLYQAGSLIKTAQRMTKVQAWQGQNFIREYRLSYQIGSTTGRSRVLYADLCRDNGLCLPALNFSMQQNALALDDLDLGLWGGTYQSPQIFPGDYNGDGLMDVLYLLKDGNNNYNWRYRPIEPNRILPDKVVMIGDEYQSKITLNYAPLASLSSSYAKDTGASACAYPCVDVQGPLYVVSEVKSSNGLGIAGAGGEYRSTYRYAGAKSDLHGRGFLGFRQMRVKDEQTGVEQATTYRQDYPFTGLVASREKKLGAQLLNRSSNTYDATNLGGTRRYPFLTSSLEESWELSGAALPAVTTAYQYDTYGNATEVSVSTGDGHGKTTTNTYANDTAGWLLGRLQRSVVTSTTPGN